MAAQLLLFFIALLGGLRVGNDREILLDGGNRHDLATAIDNLTVGGCLLQIKVLDALAPDLDDEGAIDVLSCGVVGRTAGFFVDIFVGLFLGKFVSFGNEGALCPDLVDQIDCVVQLDKALYALLKIAVEFDAVLLAGDLEDLLVRHQGLLFQLSDFALS